ncbi:hypothetical protein F0L68_28785 [Solihabitans fulvus]|uniref:Integral membrane protein n=2 Tax=Solihabitans fulvus TaxID=1892852 RepID=A0A5B2WXX5_9PSEU|nr:hypothetical protein F0L68_28785 [Solihabitans fulvus]
MLVAFVGTFVLTRLVVRMIRAGRGPFRNVSVGGLHVHHLVPGIFLMFLGGAGYVAFAPSGLAGHLLAVAFGVGAALTFDEFALWLHLKDVYWQDEGRASVDTVVLAAGVLALLVLGSKPFGDPLEDVPPWVVLAVYLVEIALVVLAAVKGRYRLALFGILAPPLAWWAAARLARPGSRWARRRYPPGSRKQLRSARRFRADSAARWRAVLDWIGGSPGDGR